MGKIVRRLKLLCKNFSFRRLARNIWYLIRIDLEKHEEDLIYRIKDEVIEECALELDDIKKNLPVLDILDRNATYEKLKNEPKSFTRLGDGEIHIIEGKDQPFQIYDPLLARKMVDILSKGRDDVYVGLNYAYFDSPNNYIERNRKFYRIRSTHYRRFFTSICDMNRQYLDASFGGAYFRFNEGYDYEGHYQRIMELFRDKDVAIVSGAGIVENLEYDLFQLAKSKMFINAPRINAFSEYDNILAEIKEKVSTDTLICLVLGMTATAMVPDLTDMGYMAWDLGHLAKEYNAYMHREEKTQENLDRFWAPD